MAKKRKSVASRLDEAERTMHSTFSTTANSLAHLYTQAMNQQTISFHDGHRHALEKLHQWISRENEEGPGLTVDDIFTHLQKELDHGGEDALPNQIQYNPIPQFANLGNQMSTASFGQATSVHGSRHGHSLERTKNLISLNISPNPIRRNLQHYQLMHGGGGSHQSNITGATETLNPEISSPGQNHNSQHFIGHTDTSMDTHSEF